MLDCGVKWLRLMVFRMDVVRTGGNEAGNGHPTQAFQFCQDVASDVFIPTDPAAGDSRRTVEIQATGMEHEVSQVRLPSVASRLGTE